MLVYHRRSFPTGNAIAQALQIPHDYQVVINSRPWNPAESFLIRWGSRNNHQMDEELGQVINSAESIFKASNKVETFKALEEANIQIPAWSEDPFELVEIMGYPLLGRDYRGARGSDIKLCLQERDFRRRKDFYTKYVPTKREFRIHVVGDEVVRVQAKYLDFPNQQLPWIRNYITGYRFRNPRLRLRPERLQAAIGSVAALGLDFGAVDLIIGDDNETYILEVNTAPSCSPLTAAAYVTAIAKLIDSPIEIDLSKLNLLSSDEEDEDSDDMDEEESEGDE